MAECFLSNLSIFTSRPMKGPASTVQCSLEMLIIDCCFQILTLGERPLPMMMLAASVCECACVHMRTVHTLQQVKSILYRPLTVLPLKDGRQQQASVSYDLVSPVPDALQSEKWPVAGLSPEDAEGDTTKFGHEQRLQEGGRHPKDTSQGSMLTYLRPLYSCSACSQQRLGI